MSDLENTDFEEEEYDVITLVDDEGLELEYIIVDSIEVDGVNYCLMIDSAAEDDEEADAIIFKEVHEDGEAMYVEIEDDREFERISDMFASDNDEYTLEV